MPTQPPEARNYFLACYAVSLVQGQTILGTLIQYSTVKKYLTAAYKLFNDRSLDFRSKYDYIEVILKALKNYEEVPKRRNMITDSMMHWLVAEAKRQDQDHATTSIVDWILLGRYTGFRSSEWCQTTQSTYKRIDEWPGQPSRAFIRSDFTFMGQNERRLHHGNELRDAMVEHLRVKWRKQKNKQNGQEIDFADDASNPEYSPTRASLRIYQRSTRLEVKDHEPMAVFKNRFGATKYITDSMVNDLLRRSAVAVLGLKASDPAVKLWSTHSIRVTAANLLHRAQLSDSYIKTRLRWLSSSFLMYLRNTIYAADAHVKALHINLGAKEEHNASYRAMEPHEHITRSNAPAA